MIDLPRPTRRLVGAAVIGVALAAAPAITALNTAPSQPVAEPACVGAESVVDGTPTCVPAPTARQTPDAEIGAGPDSQEHDGGHH